MSGGRVVAVAVLLAAVAAGAVAVSRTPPAPVSAAMTVEPAAPAAPRVVVHKTGRRLDLFDGDRLVRSYPIALASHAPGDKEREGDRRTPEGTFYVCTRNGNSRFHKFLGLSYPALVDADRGLAAGMITSADHAAIREAQHRKACPPWKTALGGEVGIHGGGADRDWTLGCIALSNDAVDELWAVLRLGDEIVVKP